MAKLVTGTYGEALYELAIEEKKEQEFLDEATAIVKIFARQRPYVSHYSDFFEMRIFDKIIGTMLKMLNKFQFVQNGQLQQYILYGLGFVIVVLICSLFNWL